MKERSRNTYLDILKAVSIILAVFGYCIQFGSGTEYAKGAFFDNTVFKIIYSFHMPLFMLVSGYLFAFSVSKAKWTSLVFRRFRQLVIPLFCWSFVSTFIEILKIIVGISEVKLSAGWLLEHIIHDFVYGPWFLWAVWWCSLIIILVRTFLKDSPIVYIMIFVLTFFIPDEFNAHFYSFMYPYFLLAYVFNNYDLKTKMAKLYDNKIAMLFSWIAFIGLLFFYNYDSFIYTSKYAIYGKNISVQIGNDCFRLIIGLVGSIAVMYLAYYIMKIVPSAVNNVVAYIGVNTLGVYLVTNVLIPNGLPLVAGSLTGVNWLWVAVETIAFLVVSLIATEIIKRIKLFNIMFLGGR